VTSQVIRTSEEPWNLPPLLVQSLFLSYLSSLRTSKHQKNLILEKGIDFLAQSGSGQQLLLHPKVPRYLPRDLRRSQSLGPVDGETCFSHVTPLTIG
jgi:hypothetical protein